MARAKHTDIFQKIATLEFNEALSMIQGNLVVTMTSSQDLKASIEDADPPTEPGNWVRVPVEEKIIKQNRKDVLLGTIQLYTVFTLYLIATAGGAIIFIKHLIESVRYLHLLLL